MSRLGTCRHTFQVQVRFGEKVDAQPHERQVREDLPEMYTCQWLDVVGALPPPLARLHNGIILRNDDCDNCPHYEAVVIGMPGLRAD